MCPGRQFFVAPSDGLGTPLTFRGGRDYDFSGVDRDLFEGVDKMDRPKSPWFLAGAVAILVAVVEAATIMRLIPGTTIVDTGALLITGFLAGLFMGFHIKRRQAE
jgi:hypothetical protein